MNALFIFITSISLLTPFSILNTGLNTTKIAFEGKQIEVEHLVKGSLDLYISHNYEKRWVTGPRAKKTKQELVVRYFLKIGNKIEKLTPLNYKKLIKRHLVNATLLHQELGKKGFRFENIPSMIDYYNRFY